MKNSNIKSKRQTKNTKKPQRKLPDLDAKKDVRGSMSLNYGGVKYEYKP